MMITLSKYFNDNPEIHLETPPSTLRHTWPRSHPWASRKFGPDGEGFCFQKRDIYRRPRHGSIVRGSCGFPFLIGNTRTKNNLKSPEPLSKACMWPGGSSYLWACTGPYLEALPTTQRPCFSGALFLWRTMILHLPLRFRLLGVSDFTQSYLEIPAKSRLYTPRNCIGQWPNHVK